MKSKSLYMLSLLIIAVAAVNITILCLAHSDAPARPLKQQSEVTFTVVNFFDAMHKGNFDAAEDCLYGSVSLGDEIASESDAGSKVLSAVLESYNYSMIGDLSINGMSAVQQVEFTYFNVESSKDTLAQYAQELYKKRISDAGNNDELYDSDGSLHEYIAVEIFNQALDRIISEKENFMSTVILDIELQYDKGEWKIIFSDTLADILLGGLYI